MWSPLASIGFATSLLSIVPTQTSATRKLGPHSLVSGGNNSNLLSTLSDFGIAVDANKDYRPSIIHNPGAVYRLMGMNSVMNLNGVDLTVFWKGVLGNTHPLELLAGCSTHVELMPREGELKDINHE